MTQQKAKQLQSKVAASRVPFVVAAMGLLGAGLVSTLWLSIAAVSGSYELQQGESDINSLSEHKEQLPKRIGAMPPQRCSAHRAAVVNGIVTARPTAAGSPSHGRRCSSTPLGEYRSSASEARSVVSA